MNWFLLAFVAPVLWAAVTLLDTYFVHGIYTDAMDGTVISGLFQSLPWLLVTLGLIDFIYPGNASAACAISAGALFLLSFLAYFKALFIANDGALMQLLWNLSVLVVPFLAWLLIGERLEVTHYVGIVLAFAGLAGFGFDVRLHTRQARKIALTMLAAVVALASSMVASKQAYQLATSRQAASGDDFWSIFLLFCAGASAAAFLLLIMRGPVHAAIQARRVADLSQRYFLVFFLAETLSLLGTLASQRAISLAPSVSFIVVIESLVPVFVMGASLLLAARFRGAGQAELASAYRAQFSNPGRKTLALAMIAGGIYVIS
jgi:uncharacterized membrane protein